MILTIGDMYQNGTQHHVPRDDPETFDRFLHYYYVLLLYWTSTCFSNCFDTVHL